MKGVGRNFCALLCLLALDRGLTAQGRPGGAPPAVPPPTPRAAAPVDLTGTWVSVVTEDWLMRMVTPKKGDYESVPLNVEGIKAADAWDPSQDGLCRAYGVGGIMRMPGRVRVTWQDDRTLRIETDAGQQTRLLHFGGTPPSTGDRTLQGYSVADWVVGGAGNLDQFTRRGDGPGQQPWGLLRVRTTYMRPGWLRRNGVPYSQSAVITETFTRFTHPRAGDWFVVTTIVEDPTYLSQPFVTSSNFRKETTDAKWSPSPCRGG